MTYDFMRVVVKNIAVLWDVTTCRLVDRYTSAWCHAEGDYNLE